MPLLNLILKRNLSRLSGFLQSLSKTYDHQGLSLIGLMLVAKGALFGLGSLIYPILTNQGFQTSLDYLKIWNRWDAINYLHIAKYGYTATGENAHLLAFFPLLPLLMRLVTGLTHNLLVSGFIISGLTSVTTGLLLYRLVRLDFRRSIAQRAIWFLFIFPTSYFLHIPYTESLFLTLALGSFLAARSDHWQLAGILGMTACLSRVNGLVLIPALAAEALHQYWQTRRFKIQWLWIGLIGVGIVGYLLLNIQVTGHPFTFMHLQKQAWGRSLDWPWHGIWISWQSLSWRTPSDGYLVVLQEILFAILSLIFTIWSWFKLRPAYSVWMTGNWLLFTSNSLLYSVPRYVLILFPLYILFAHLAKNSVWYAFLTMWSLLFLAFFASQFMKGAWAF
jgi:hypothetical protein